MILTNEEGKLFFGDAALDSFSWLHATVAGGREAPTEQPVMLEKLSKVESGRSQATTKKRVRIVAKDTQRYNGSAVSFGPSFFLTVKNQRIEIC